jgi:hypothetical protein
MVVETDKKSGFSHNDKPEAPSLVRTFFSFTLQRLPWRRLGFECVHIVHSCKGNVAKSFVVAPGDCRTFAHGVGL